MNDPQRSSRPPRALRRAARIFELVYPNLTLVFSLLFIVFWILDRFNPVMGFISGSMSKMLMIVFFSLVFVGSIVTIVLDALGLRRARRDERESRSDERGQGR